MRLTNILTVAALSCCASFAIADQHGLPSAYDHNVFYLSGEMGIGTSNLGNLSPGRRASGFVFDVDTGFQFNPHWATQVEFHQFPHETVTVNQQNNEYRTYLISPQLRYQEELNPTWYAYLSAGPAWQRVVAGGDTAINHWGAAGGVGLGYHLLPNVVAELSVDGTAGKCIKTADVLAGLAFLLPTESE